MNTQLPTRIRVLSLYRQILKTGKTWEARNPKKTDEERSYIYEHARYLFKRNKDITDPERIEHHIFEAYSRLELAKHYRIPYPRPYHLAKRAGLPQEDDYIVPAYMVSLSYKDIMEPPKHKWEELDPWEE